SRPLRTEVFNVVDYGAIGDGITDDTQAFMDAWKAACNSKSANSTTMYIPHGKTYLLQPIIFNGRCKSNNINFQIDGKITAPSDPYDWKCDEDRCDHWIVFEHFEGRLSIHGSGTINGQGKNWWSLSCKHHQNIGFIINHSYNVHINHLRFEDSPQMHIALERSRNVHASNLTIQAPGNSPNTDGIHIQHSSNVFIHNTLIKTGDDCISIGDGSSHISIRDIACGPGHGISIGSLGVNGENETVEFVRVRDVHLTGTTNGVRIKTWQGGKGYARNILFERITSHGSTRPIVIDQYYCPHQYCKNETSAVQISNVMYSQISGTSHRQIAVELACSESTPCTDIFMKDIHLQSTEDGDETSSYCLNVRGLRNSQVFPNVPCLLQGEDF
ncbi:Glyco_hydro_28 domain-containing protein, partial [Cephalotus follicularis]